MAGAKLLAIYYKYKGEWTAESTNIYSEMKWNESGFRPPLCTYRLNWAKRTSWGWWDDWDDTVLQTQDPKFEPWRSEVEHATSRSRRLPTILTSTRGWGRNILVSLKPPRPGTEPRTLAWKAAVLTTTLGPPPIYSEHNKLNKLVTYYTPMIILQASDVVFTVIYYLVILCFRWSKFKNKVETEWGTVIQRRLGKITWCIGLMIIMIISTASTCWSRNHFTLAPFVLNIVDFGHIPAALKSDVE